MSSKRALSLKNWQVQNLVSVLIAARKLFIFTVYFTADWKIIFIETTMIFF
jgi:hypothetical protein